MLINILYPFSDIRPFIQNHLAASIRLGWPIPDDNQNFVRGFGAIRRRPSGGVTGGIGEDRICDAHRAMRLPDFPRAYIGSREMNNFRLDIIPRYRRFYSDGLAVAKYELGIQIKRFEKEICEEVFLNLMRRLLSCESSIYDGGSFVRCSIGEAGKFLSRNILISTTKRMHLLEESMMEWVKAGSPLIFVYCKDSEIRFSLKNKKRILFRKHSDKNLCFYNGFLNLGRRFPIWLFLENRNSERNYLRNLRICISRFHAERECLRLVLKGLGTGKLRLEPRSELSDAFQEYINKSTSRILKLEKTASTLNCSQFIEDAKQLIELASPGETDSILQAISNLEMRGNIFRKVKNYMEKETNLTFSGPVYVQGSISGDAEISNPIMNLNHVEIRSKDWEKLEHDFSQLEQKLKETNKYYDPDLINAIDKIKEIIAKRDQTGLFNWLKISGKKVIEFAKEVSARYLVDLITRAVSDLV